MIFKKSYLNCDEAVCLRPVEIQEEKVVGDSRYGGKLQDRLFVVLSAAPTDNGVLQRIIDAAPVNARYPPPHLDEHGEVGAAFYVGYYNSQPDRNNQALRAAMDTHTTFLITAYFDKEKQARRYRWEKCDDAAPQQPAAGGAAAATTVSPAAPMAPSGNGKDARIMCQCALKAAVAGHKPGTSVAVVELAARSNVVTLLRMLRDWPELVKEALGDEEGEDEGEDEDAEPVDREEEAAAVAAVGAPDEDDGEIPF